METSVETSIAGEHFSTKGKTTLDLSRAGGYKMSRIGDSRAELAGRLSLHELGRKCEFAQFYASSEISAH